MNFILAATVYITTDPFFWASMAFTTMVGIFIGAVIYNGDVKEIRKALIALASYCVLIIITNASRVFPQLDKVTPDLSYMPFAGIVTIVIVTFFYLLGMVIGVRITKHAHRNLKK